MKTYQNTRRSKGFTLIELLVVITIIAVLAAMSFAGVNVAIKKARKTQGLVAATGLVNAVEAYYSDYNRLPDLSGAEMKTDSGAGQELLRILLAEETTSTSMENPKSNIYLQLPEAKSKKKGNGIYYGDNGTTAQALYDPFGEPYTVVLNLDYEESLTFSFGGKQYRLRGKQAAVYSAGADKEEGTSDDITSWPK